MKIYYRICNNWDKNQIQILRKFNINIEIGYNYFDIEEGDFFFRLKPYLDRWKVNESYGTIFDESDINRAKLLVFGAAWANGYPQPENNFGYKDITYKKQNYC